MIPDIIRSSQACIMYAKEKGYWPSYKEWDMYAYKYGFYSAEKLSCLGIWDDLQKLSVLNIIQPTKRSRKINWIKYEKDRCLISKQFL